MLGYTATATTKGQILIPAALLRKYGIDAGTRVRIIDLGDRLVLVPLNAEYLRSLRGSLSGGGAIDALMAMREEDRQR